MDENKFLDLAGLSYYTNYIKYLIEHGDTLSQDIHINLDGESSIGGFKDGDVIKSGTSLEYLLQQLLTNEVKVSSSDWGTLGGNE